MGLVLAVLFAASIGTAAAKSYGGIDSLRAAADQGDAAAQYELGMEILESRNAATPRKVDRLGLSLGFIGLTMVAFAVALAALQSGTLTGWQRPAASAFVHVVGPLLVLDTLLTYTTWFLTWNCGHDFLATACTQIADRGTRHFLNELGDFQMVNLIFRFMAMVGFFIDALAVLYLVYVWRQFVRPQPALGLK